MAAKGKDSQAPVALTVLHRLLSLDYASWTYEYQFMHCLLLQHFWRVAASEPPPCSVLLVI